MKRFVLFVIVISLVSCASSFKKLMYGGKVVQKNFKESIPFDFTKGLPIIKVNIQGSEYSFLFDTGAPNVISKELAGKIKYKIVTRPQIKDSQGAKRKQVSIRIPNIKIGNIDFEDTGAIIIDYMSVYEMACVGFDGIIGSNLMAKAFWELDYEKSELSFSDKLISFEIPDEAYVLPFTPHNSQQKPTVKIKVNQLTYKKVTFDTGASGAFGLKTAEAKAVIEGLEGALVRGSVSSGVYGAGKVSMTKYALVDSVKLGGIRLENQVVEFESSGAMTLGNAFLKNYRVILDWADSKIYLVEITTYDNKKYANFGWLGKIKNNKMWVGGIVKESMAEQLGIELGTQVLQINEMDLRNISNADGCQFLTSKPLEKVDSIKMIILKDGKEEEISLRREVFVSGKEN